MILTKKGNRVNKFQGAYNRIEYFIYKVEKYGEFNDFDKLLKDFKVEKDLDILKELVSSEMAKEYDENIISKEKFMELFLTKNNKKGDWSKQDE